MLNLRERKRNENEKSEKKKIKLGAYVERHVEGRST